METTIIVGIDEAGYGPLLGPLVVSAVAFEVPVDCFRDSKTPRAALTCGSCFAPALAQTGEKRQPSRRGRQQGPLRFLRSRSRAQADRARGAHLPHADRLAAPATLRDLLCQLCPAICDETRRVSADAPEAAMLPAQASASDIAVQRECAVRRNGTRGRPVPRGLGRGGA